MEENNSSQFNTDLASKRRISTISSIGGFAGIIIGVILLASVSRVGGIILLIAGAASLVVAYKAGKELKNITIPVRRSVLEESMQLESYDANGHFPKDMIKETKLFKQHQRQRSCIRKIQEYPSSLL